MARGAGIRAYLSHARANAAGGRLAGGPRRPHTARMLGTLISMLIAVALLAFWFVGRAAAETATYYGRQACRNAGVVWLDQSVHLLSMRPRRGSDGWIGLERHYGFEYSIHGDDRHAGRIVLHGRRLRSLVGPMPVREPVHAGPGPT